MKTEQEQIEDIIKILLDASKKCFDVDCDCCEKQYEKDCAQYSKAKALVQAGYGDVSEYKAEIERLKAENKKDFENFVKVNDELLKANIKLSVDKKQAQIDVLNRLKEKLEDCTGCYIPDCFESPTDNFAYDEKEVKKYIDELIKEVEGQ